MGSLSRGVLPPPIATRSAISVVLAIFQPAPMSPTRMSSPVARSAAATDLQWLLMNVQANAATSLSGLRFAVGTADHVEPMFAREGESGYGMKRAAPPRGIPV